MMTSAQEHMGATPEQVCMMGLYALGANLLNSLSQASHSTTSADPSAAPPVSMAAPRRSESNTRLESQSPIKSPVNVLPKKNFIRRSIEEHSVRSDYPPMKRVQAKSISRGRSFDLLSGTTPVPQPRQPMLMSEFSSNASKLGIAGTPLETDAPPSPLSSAVELGALPELAMLGDVKTKSQKAVHWPWLPSFLMASPRREARAGSAPDTSLDRPPELALRDGPRSRARSLDVPRLLSRTSFNTVRSKKPARPAMRTEFEAAPQLDAFCFPSVQGEVLICDLPQESTSSSESEYDEDYEHGFGRRHSIGVSSGHESIHARAREHSGGSFASTAPSTVMDSIPVSSFGSDEVSCNEGESDDEDDIEWEQPHTMRSCLSPTPLNVTDLSRQYCDAPLQVHYEEPPCRKTYGKPAKEASRMSLSPKLLLRRGPRRITSSSSLSGKSVESADSSFSGLARRSFSQARSLLKISPAHVPTADAEDQPAAVCLQPINVGLISRPCQTTPNHISNSRRSYLATSEESGSITGTGSGASSTSRSGRSWESVPPELAALEELILTECKFMSDLQLMMDVYVKGLRKMGLVTDSSLEKITSNLGEIMAFSKFLIDCVREFLPRRPSPNTSISSQPSYPDGRSQHQASAESKVRAADEVDAPNYLGLSSKLVTELPARMEVFARYCMNYQGAKERLEFERHLRPSVATFIELSKSTNPALQGMDMQQFLVLPVQRVTRYPLLFGCLAKQSDKHRDENNNIREEDEDAGFTDGETSNNALQQRQDRAKTITDNWIRLRDASSAICGITNLAISYQQGPPKFESSKARVSSPSISSPIIPFSGEQLGQLPKTTIPALSAMMMTDKAGPVTVAPAVAPPPSKLLSSNFSFSMTKRRISAEKPSTGTSMSRTLPGSVLDTTSTPLTASSSTSNSLFGRLLKPFRHSQSDRDRSTRTKFR